MGDCCINAGSLESFVSNLKETQKQDVLDSSLLALKTQKLVQILRERHGKPWMGNSLLQLQRLQDESPLFQSLSSDAGDFEHHGRR